MKFRGKIEDIGSIQLFTRTVNTVAKLAKNIAVRITPSHVYLIMNEKVATAGTMLWCEMQQDNFFSEYSMDGVSQEYNEIFLELTVDLLVRALKSAQSAKSLKLKLTKKHSPCLTLEVELPSLISASRIVIHDIPVNVIPRRMWQDYEEPEMMQFQITIHLPPLKTLRNVVDRMKNLSSFVIISANHDGEMTLKVETDLVVVTTHFKDLELPPAAKVTQQEDHAAEVRVDIRKLNQFLSCQVIPTNIVCNIVNQRQLHMFLLHEEVSLQYVLSAVTN